MTENHHPSPIDTFSRKQEGAEEYEINLIDLWLVLVRRKKIIIGIMLISILLGVTAAIMQPQKYNYHTSLNIGRYVLDNKAYPIQFKKTVQNKIEDIYLPKVLNEYHEAHPDQGKDWRLTIKSPRNSQTITIDGLGDGDAQFYLSVLQSIIDEVDRSHKGIMKKIKEEQELRLRKFTYDIARQQDDERLLVAQKARIKEKLRLTRGNMKELKRLILVEESNIGKVLNERKTEVKVMLLFVLNNKILTMRNNIISLQEDLLVNLPNERDFLDNTIKDLHREQMKTKDKILLLKAEFGHPQETQMLEPPVQSRAQIFPDKKLIILLAIVGGVVLGVFVSFFIEFIEKARLEYKVKMDVE